MDSLRVSSGVAAVQDGLTASGAVAAPSPAGGKFESLAKQPDGTSGAQGGSARQRATDPGATSAAPSGSGAAQPATAKPAAAKPALDAIGTQMVLVFDDQTHVMTVKILDIETQKVQQPLAPDDTPAIASRASSATTAAVPASGTLINTKA